MEKLKNKLSDLEIFFKPICRSSHCGRNNGIYIRSNDEIPKVEPYHSWNLVLSNSSKNLKIVYLFFILPIYHMYKNVWYRNSIPWLLTFQYPKSVNQTDLLKNKRLGCPLQNLSCMSNRRNWVVAACIHLLLELLFWLHCWPWLHLAWNIQSCRLAKILTCPQSFSPLILVVLIASAKASSPLLEQLLITP